MNDQNVNQPFNISVKNIQDRLKLKKLSKLLKKFTLIYRLISLSCKLIFFINVSPRERRSRLTK